MPQTIRNTDGSVEFEAATDAEVADLIAEFEAAKVARDEAYALADEAYGEHPRYGSDEYTAKQEVVGPHEVALAAANRALSASRNLPVGTEVRFSTSAGWSGDDSDSGVIEKVTESSYVVRKDGSGNGTARLNRETAHEWKSSYGRSGGGRSLSVVRTPAQHRAHVVEQAERNRVHAAQNAERRAYNDAVYAAQRAQGEQAVVLYEARRRALDLLVRKHQAEFDALLSVTLDVLAVDAPGRDESTLPAAPTT